MLLHLFCFFCFKQKTAYEMRISDWSSDVCSSDLIGTFSSLDDVGTAKAVRNRGIFDAHSPCIGGLRFCRMPCFAHEARGVAENGRHPVAAAQVRHRPSARTSVV